MSHVWLNIHTPQAQGRHLFPVAPQIACLLALGWARLARGNDGRMRSTAVASILGALLVLALFCLVGVILVEYAPR